MSDSIGLESSIVFDGGFQSRTNTISRVPEAQNESLAATANLANSTQDFGQSQFGQEIGAKAADARPAQMKNRLLVVETAERLRGLYTQLEKRYFDDVKFYASAETAIREWLLAPALERADIAVDCVVMNIPTENQAATYYVEILCRTFPNAKIILTAERDAAKYLDDILAISERVKLVVKPFSYTSLMGHLREYRKLNSRVF